MKLLDVIALIFALLGAITWGTIGFFDWNLINFFFTNSKVETVIYDIIGVCAVWVIIRSKWGARLWK